MFPIIIDFSRLFLMIVQKYSRLYCHRCINNKNKNCPSFCFKIKYLFIGRIKTENELLFAELAHKLNLKILEKRADFEANYKKKLYYN